ncbi:probable RNA-binding protein EIF1AD isoform X2 [Coturnix japonica]|uniref:probable RNA-binding protein EIF1AD isoform X2 n=1 Tax=Coturnix japonica TaxID=93934 RepID=UPI0013A5C04A|nr:probable RNA-binding protein EIF1AD isoform X2 [Coturnix japonica]
MSRATKRKHVTREVLEEHVVPTPQQRIVRVLSSPGNNLHEVEASDGSRFLVSMPARFRHHVWIKRGDYLLVDPIEEGVKVKAEMSLLLLRPHVRFLQHQGLWPAAFTASSEPAQQEGNGDTELFVNTNRAPVSEEEDGGDTGEDEEDTGDDEEDTEDGGDTGDDEAGADKGTESSAAT